MTAARSTYDVVVAGAGPAGAATAVGFARQGAQVLLLEANPKAATRFAGEWVHPTGAAILERLGLTPARATAAHAPCEGFAVFPDDASAPIQLRYDGGALGFTCHHGALVEQLREEAAATDGVEYLENARLTELDGQRVVIQPKNGPTRILRASRVVGADGRSSIVRRSLFGEREADLVGHMAGLELEGVDLPFEGYGHVLLGGPGPVLLYRIAPGRVRACVDIPEGHPGARRDARYLWEAFAPLFPVALRSAFRTALETQRLVWACNRFLPRTFYGKNSYSRPEDPPELQRPSSAISLRSLLEWPIGRPSSSAETTSRPIFPRNSGGSSGRGYSVALVGDAVGFYHPLTASGITIGLKDAEALVAAPDVAAYRAAREPKSYLPELLANALHQVFTREDEGAAAVRKAVYTLWQNSASERRRTMRFLGGEDVPIAEFGRSFSRVAREAATSTLRTGGFKKLPAFVEFAQWPVASFVPRRIRERMRVESSAFHPMRGLGVTPARAVLPELPATSSAKVDVDALLARVVEGDDEVGPCEALRRAVAEERSVDEIQEAAVVVSARVLSTNATTEAAREVAVALAEALLAHPGLARGRVRDALARIQKQLLATQAPEGDFGTTRDTALGLEALSATGLPIFHPAMRRAARALCARQAADGGFGEATAVAARAILRTEAPFHDTAERALASLASTPSPLGAEAGEALRLYRDRRSTRLAPAKQRRKSSKPKAADASDHAYCMEALLAVSRSFARPIEMLPGELKTAVMCGYLLCRIADTIEDNPYFTTLERDLRYQLFLDALQASPDAECTRAFERAFEDIRGDDTENQLARRLSTVMRVYRGIPEGMQRKASHWVAEMVRGMQLYSHRAPGHDGFTALQTPEDLERYCYFVAGTVGHMLTDLFVEAFGEPSFPRGLDEVPSPNGVNPLGPPPAQRLASLATRSFRTESLELRLREHAEAFGVGLQLVNILKDVTDDRTRRVSFIPRTSCARQGIDIVTLVDPDVRDRAHATVAPLFDTAQQRLHRALEYTLAIPREQTAVRLFCLLPLWMAVRTLVHARGNDAMFTPGSPVKIARSEVEHLIADCIAHCGDDQALRTRYDALWQTPAAPGAMQSALH